jgi:hypothetical protein
VASLDPTSLTIYTPERLLQDYVGKAVAADGCGPLTPVASVRVRLCLFAVHDPARQEPRPTKFAFSIRVHSCLFAVSCYLPDCIALPASAP